MTDRVRRSSALALLACAVLVAGCGEQEQGDVVLATTTSTQDSGLLDVLVPAFEQRTGYRVKAVAVGSGQALELGARGEADVVLAHAPAAERELVATGVTGGRLLVMHNDFVILGPPGDPAGIASAPSAADALQAIASAEALFVSRGDDSGTHRLELALWEEAGLRPSSSWYLESGQGMGQTIGIAAEKSGYTVADRATHLATAGASGLAVLVEGDPALLNVYHAIPITRRAGGRVNEDGGRALAAWLVSEEAQALIATFGVAEHGRPLFVPDAGLTEAQLAVSR